MAENAITLRQVQKKYCLYKRNVHRVFETLFPFGKQYHKPFLALKHIDIDVRRGETVGIIGRNGSGKSTMLQVICGILQPTEGEVVINGKISALLELGAGFNPEFSGRDNIYLSTSIMGFSKEDTNSKYDQIVDFADIGEFIDQPVKMYSSGMFVRLAFATAISMNPDILIVDEALAVGDIFFQQKCMEHMKKIMDEKTIVLVSHDMQAVSSLCDRVIVLEDGKKLFDGSTLEGISLYTRLVHNELFTKESNKVSEESAIPNEIIHKLEKYEKDFRFWLPVDSSSKGGAGAVSILKVSITKNGDLFKTIETKDKVTVRMLVFSTKELPKAIFGYTIKDRLGLAVFGENSVATMVKSPELNSGYSLVSFEFEWPEVLSQEYTLTIGIGEGEHAMDHTIQCWAHNIASFTAITPGRFVHGMFNNKMCSLELRSI